MADYSILQSIVNLFSKREAPKFSVLESSVLNSNSEFANMLGIGGGENPAAWNSSAEAYPLAPKVSSDIIQKPIYY